jgi:hypothetical protein
MSADDKRVLPLPRDRRRGAGRMILLAVGGALIGAPIVIFALTLQEKVFGFCCFYGLLYGLPLIAAGLLLSRAHRKYLAHVAEMEEIARATGLAFQERVTADVLEPYRDFVLFRLTERMKLGACHLFRGQFYGSDVLAFEYEYLGRLAVEEADSAVKVRLLRRVQTVVIMPNVGDLPAFHAGPADNEWSAAWPGWVGRAGVGPVVLEMDTVAHEPTVVHSREEKRVEALFRRERIKLLGSLTECVLESRGGHLLFYSPDLDVPPSGVPRTLGRAVDVARALTTPEEQLPGYRPEEEQITTPEPGRGAAIQAEPPGERPADEPRTE